MFTCQPIEFKNMSKEDRVSRRGIAHKWWSENAIKIKYFLNAYNALSIKAPIPDSKITELHKSGLDALTQEAKILASQVIACEHVWANWNAETCDKMYKDGMEVENALFLLCAPIDMAARVRAVQIERFKDPWYKWAEGVKVKPWGPHLHLTPQCLMSDSYHTYRDQRWRHLWEEDREGGNRSQRMDVKIEAEEDAATLKMTEQQRILFQMQRAARKKDAAWRNWKYEKNEFDQGIGSSVRVDAAKIAWDRTEYALDLVRVKWVEWQKHVADKDIRYR